jgi:hypothetical protein
VNSDLKRREKTEFAIDEFVGALAHFTTGKHVSLPSSTPGPIGDPIGRTMR